MPQCCGNPRERDLWTPSALPRGPAPGPARLGANPLVAPGPCITRACIEVAFDHTCMCLFREHDPIDLRCSSHSALSTLLGSCPRSRSAPVSAGLAPGVHRVAVERGHQQLPLAPKPRGTKPGSESTSVPTARRTAVGRHGTAARVRHSYWNSIW